jgi:hypothetical protein
MIHLVTLSQVVCSVCSVVIMLVCREEVEVFCHVVWAVARQVSTGEEQAGADTFVAGVWRAAADRRARFPAFPSLPGSSVWRVLQILEVDLTFFFLQKTSQDASKGVGGMFLGLPDPDPLVRGMDPDPDPFLFS